MAMDRKKNKGGNRKTVQRTGSAMKSGKGGPATPSTLQDNPRAGRNAGSGMGMKPSSMKRGR